MWLSHARGRAQTHGRRCGEGPSSGWLGNRQRACPWTETGETDAAEPGQAETGPADQATREHANVEDNANRAQVEEGSGSTHGRTEIESERTRKNGLYKRHEIVTD
ncbi:MAG: hypothetical protein KF682_20595 [Nitrospira sp.]|nr:hypothetical protein [Nitrospira sp.]